MYSRLAVIAAAVSLSACTFAFPPPGGQSGAARGDASSCSQLAERQADAQYAADTSALDDREGGILGRDSGVQRDLAKIDAESRRRALYKNCLRLRGLPDEPEGEPAR